MRKFLRNDATTLILRLALLYVVWFLCRIVFYLQNAELIGPLECGEIPALLRGSVVFDTVSFLYVNSLFIILSLLPFRFRGRDWYRKMLFWIYAVTNSLALIVNVSDGVYFHYVKKRFTADELSYLGTNDNNSAIVLKGMAENWYIVLFAVLMIALMVWGYRKIKYAPTQIGNPWKYFTVNFVVFLLGIALSIGGIRGGFGSSHPLMLSNATLYTGSDSKANLILSNMFCMLRTLGNKAIVYTKFFDEPALDSIYTPYHYPQPDAPSLGKRNIVIFILESFSSEHSALLNPDLYPAGDPGYTPFLDSLMRDGYYFTNAFATGRKSIDALPSVLASIPSYQEPFVLMPQSIAKMQAMPQILDSLGYSTSFFNGSARGSMGFGAFTNLAGIGNYYSMEDYEKARGKNDYDGWWGIWDGPFLQYMAQVLSETPQPFMASVFTLSSHHPFKVPAGFEGKFREGKTKNHKCVAYSDRAVRDFMEAARKEDWYKNTIFVFFADHVSSETFAPKTLTPVGSTHIIGLIYTPDGALRGVDARPAAQTDIMPTLLGLIGYDKPYFAFGRDVINETERLPLVVNMGGGHFQAISDSVSLLFDGNKTIAAYNRTDTLQTQDISGSRTSYLEEIERQTQARLQQYYEHVERSNYRVPEAWIDEQKAKRAAAAPQEAIPAQPR